MKWLSIILRAAMVPLHVAWIALHRAAELLDSPRYRIRGRCHNNGRCCQRLLLVEHPFLTWPVLHQVTLWWMQSVYPFVITDSSILDPDSGEYFRILTCRNLHERRCKEYSLRPRVCREWPVPQHCRPILFAGCGFLAVDGRGEIDGDVSRRRSQDPRQEAQALISRFTHKKYNSHAGGKGLKD